MSDLTRVQLGNFESTEAGRVGIANDLAGGEVSMRQRARGVTIIADAPVLFERPSIAHKPGFDLCSSDDTRRCFPAQNNFISVKQDVRARPGDERFNDDFHV